MPTVDARIAALREFLKSHATGETVFIVEGGGEYHTKEVRTASGFLHTVP